MIAAHTDIDLLACERCGDNDGDLYEALDGALFCADCMDHIAPMLVPPTPTDRRRPPTPVIANGPGEYAPEPFRTHTEGRFTPMVTPPATPAPHLEVIRVHRVTTHNQIRPDIMAILNDHADGWWRIEYADGTFWECDGHELARRGLWHLTDMEA